jgi:hypothetical protein
LQVTILGEPVLVFLTVKDMQGCAGCSPTKSFHACFIVLFAVSRAIDARPHDEDIDVLQAA